MKLDPNGQVIVNSNDVFNSLYNGIKIRFEDLFFDDSETIEQFNRAVALNGDSIPKLYLYSQDLEKSQNQFDQENQANWFMPEEYKNFDIENYILCQAPDIAGYTRVEQELELFRQHDMIMLLKYLKYLVDTMRQNNIVWGVGRGSSVASYVLYLMGVHKIDSIKYNLDIREFLK